MTLRSPRYSLEVTRPVLNIGDEQISALKKSMGTGKRLETLQDKVLAPARRGKMEIISSHEMRRLLRHVGQQAVSEGYIGEIKEHLDAALDERPTAIETATYPTDNQPFGKGRLLTAARSSEAMLDRIKAKEALLEYYELDEVPSEVWHSDELATCVWLARSHKEGGNQIVNSFDRIIEARGNILPLSTELGPVAVTPIIPKKP